MYVGERRRYAEDAMRHRWATWLCITLVSAGAPALAEETPPEEAPLEERLAIDEPRGGVDHPTDVALALGYTLGGTMGLVATILGLVGLSEQLEAEGLEDDLLDDYGDRPCLASGDQRCVDVETAYKSHRDLANPALWIGVAGATVLLGTLVYHVASLGDPEDEEIAVTPFFGPEGGGLGLRARF